MTTMTCGCKNTTMCADHEKQWWDRHHEANARQAAQRAEGLKHLRADILRDQAKPEWDDLP